MKKYRIEVTELNNGERIYIAQRGTLKLLASTKMIAFITILFPIGLIVLVSLIDATLNGHKGAFNRYEWSNCHEQSLRSLNGAKSCIDKIIEEEKSLAQKALEDQQRADGYKLKKKSYIKHP